jgi:hypothetical protein
MGMLDTINEFGAKHPKFLVVMQSVSVVMMVTGIIGIIIALMEGPHPI